MDDREYMNADREVIGLVNRGHGPGGELPRVPLTFIPKDRVEKVEALDRRILRIQKAMPAIVAGACLLCWLIGWSM